VARKMGLPIERIVVATNTNDILARAFQTGRYARGPVAATQSPAMDIQVASNFERLYFEAVERTGGETSRAMRAFADQGVIDIPPKALAAMREVFVGAHASEAETARAIVSTYQASGELIDPHTAVAVHAAGVVGPKRRTTPMVALATAHPAKFPQSVENASGAAPSTPRAVKALARRAEQVDRLPAEVEAVKAYIRDFAGA
jgi:threonine synthase